MKLTIKAAIAAACALGMTTAFAQTVQRGEAAAVKGTQTVAQASTIAPVQVAQAAGGAAGGASTGGAVGGIGVAGSVGSTVVFVGAAVAAAAATSGGTSIPTSH